MRQHHVHLRANNIGHLLVALNVKILQTFCLGHRRDDANLATVVGQTFCQQMSSCGFKHSGLNRTVDEQTLSRLPLHAILVLQATLTQEQAFGRSEPCLKSLQMQKPCNEVTGASGIFLTNEAHHRNSGLGI